MKPERATELLDALRRIEAEQEGATVLDRQLSYALHRLAMESQVMLTEAWPGAFDRPMVGTIRAVQEMVERILSGRDVRFYQTRGARRRGGTVVTEPGTAAWPEPPAAGPLGDGRHALAVLRPESVDELCQAVRDHVGRGHALYPQGGSTALDYGGVPRRPGVAIDTRALCRVIDYPARRHDDHRRGRDHGGGPPRQSSPRRTSGC